MLFWPTRRPIKKHFNCARHFLTLPNCFRCLQFSPPLALSLSFPTPWLKKSKANANKNNKTTTHQSCHAHRRRLRIEGGSTQTSWQLSCPKQLGGGPLPAPCPAAPSAIVGCDRTYPLTPLPSPSPTNFSTQLPPFAGRSLFKFSLWFTMKFEAE